MFYLNYLQEGMIVFDVGAFIGEMTLLFSRFIGEKGQIHAFEAHSQTFKQLETTCIFAARNNIILNNLAVSDHEGSVELYFYDQKYLSLNSLADRPLQNYGINIDSNGTESVEATTLDIYCDHNGIGNIDLLKIDVEGAEYQVLIGAQNMLKENRIRCIMFEFGQATFDMGNRPEEIKSFLSRFGYKIRNVMKDEPIFPGGSSALEARYSMHIAAI